MKASVTCINFQLKPVRSLDSLRSAWSGRLRHGPLPSTTSTTSNSTDIYDASITSDSFSSTLESSSTSSSVQCANNKLGDTLLDISDSSNANSSSWSLISSKTSDNIPFASLNSSDDRTSNSTAESQAETSGRIPHEFVNPTNPFFNQIIPRNKPVEFGDDIQRTTGKEYGEQESDITLINKPLCRNSWNNNLLDTNLNVTDPSFDDPFDTSQILNPFHPQNPLFHTISPKPSLNSIQPLPPLNIQHYSAQAKVNTITSLFYYFFFPLIISAFCYCYLRTIVLKIIIQKFCYKQICTIVSKK